VNQGLDKILRDRLSRSESGFALIRLCPGPVRRPGMGVHNVGLGLEHF
jgi:hypothetical protein